MPPLQPERFEQILHARMEWGSQHGISPEAIETILSAIHSESLKRQ
jgi:chorismate mutase